MAVGNLEAIRDWMIGNSSKGIDNNWYTKEQIHLLLRVPTEYHLTFFGLPNQQLTLSEAEVSGNSFTYNITLNAQGTLEGDYKFMSDTIKVRTKNNMLNESQLDLNNWTKNTPMSNAYFNCVFEPYIKLVSPNQTITEFNGINTVKFKSTTSGYFECIRFAYVDYNWDTYRFDMDYYTPTGFNLIGGSSECFSGFYPSSPGNAGIYYSSGYYDIFRYATTYTNISNEAANTYTHYYNGQTSGRKNDTYSAIIDFGEIARGTEVTLKFSGLQVRRNP